MADYSKRDARRNWVAQMAAHSEPPQDQRPRCHCGELAVIAFTPANGLTRFFCTAHEAEADALFQGAGLTDANDDL
jgi:hypothetical protein